MLPHLKRKSLQSKMFIQNRIFRAVEAVVFTALLPLDTKIHGEYIWHDKTIVDWITGPLPALM